MNLITALLAALLVSQPCVALAQPTSAPTSAPTSRPALLKLPKGTRLKTPQGTFQGYSLAEFKVVLKIEADYRSWGKQIPILEKLVKDSEQLAENRHKQVKLLQNQVVTLKTDRARITKKWTEENRLRHICENKPAFGSWISWGIAAAATATAAVLAGILIAKD
jgi:hypothetical protein